MSRTELKIKAQEEIMGGIANVLGYWDPEDFGEKWTPEELAEFRKVMQREADRVAKLFGYE